MKKDQSAEGKRTIQASTTLYLAIELSNTKWKLAFSNGSKNRFVTINARDLSRFHLAVDESKKRLGLASNGQTTINDMNERKGSFCGLGHAWNYTCVKFNRWIYHRFCYFLFSETRKTEYLIKGV